MEPAKQELEKAINDAPFQTPVCPIYQNVDAKPHTRSGSDQGQPDRTADRSGVRWTYIVKNMLAGRHHRIHRARPRHTFFRV